VIAAFEWPERVGVGSMTPYSSDQSCQATTSSWSLSRSSVALNAQRALFTSQIATSQTRQLVLASVV